VVVAVVAGQPQVPEVVAVVGQPRAPEVAALALVLVQAPVGPQVLVPVLAPAAEAAAQTARCRQKRIGSIDQVVLDVVDT
jgi:hypothetical protein